MAAGDWKEMLKACEEGNLELVQHHVQAGVDPNYQHPEYMTTPLIVSIEYGHKAICVYLLEQGANPSLKAGFSEDTPMKIARRYKRKGIMKLLKDAINNNSEE
jgi:ankyrin repeat protein